MEESNQDQQEQMILRMHMERRQQLLMQQLQRQKQQQQQQQSAMSMFPSSFDSHLRPQGLILTRPVNPSLENPNLNPNLIQQQNVTNQQMMMMHQQQQQQQREREQRSMMLHQQRKEQLDQEEQRTMMMMMMQQQQQKQQEQRSMMMMMKQKQEQEQQKSMRPLNPLELQFAYQDAWRVCHPDFKRPFASLEDACERLLPYHVVSDYEAEEDDRIILDSDTTSQPLSRSQQWDNNIAAKVSEFTATFEKQAEAFNILTQKRKDGELRSEERLSIEQLLLQDERKACVEVKSELDSEIKAQDPRLRMSVLAQAGQVKAAESGIEMMGRNSLRANAIANHSEQRRSTMNHDEMMMMMMNGWMEES